MGRAQVDPTAPCTNAPRRQKPPKFTGQTSQEVGDAQRARGAEGLTRVLISTCGGPRNLGRGLHERHVGAILGAGSPRAESVYLPTSPSRKFKSLGHSSRKGLTLVETIVSDSISSWCCLAHLKMNPKIELFLHNLPTSQIKA